MSPGRHPAHYLYTIVLLGFCSAVKMEATAKEPASIVLLGDSITQGGFSVGGWGARLAERYIRKADVINRGLSGYNTEWILEVLPDLLSGVASREKQLVAVFLGANDAAVDGGASSRQHITVPRYVANLKKIVAAVSKTLPNARFLLIAPPPVHGRPERLNEVTQAYAAAAVALGGELGIPVCDLWTAATGEPDWPRLLSDGLHLSAAGDAFVYEAVAAALERGHPELAAAALPRFCPAHDAFKRADDSCNA